MGEAYGVVGGGVVFLGEEDVVGELGGVGEFVFFEVGGGVACGGG